MSLFYFDKNGTCLGYAQTGKLDLDGEVVSIEAELPESGTVSLSEIHLVDGKVRFGVYFPLKKIYVRFTLSDTNEFQLAERAIAKNPQSEFLIEFSNGESAYFDANELQALYDLAEGVAFSTGKVRKKT